MQERQYQNYDSVGFYKSIFDKFHQIARSFLVYLMRFRSSQPRNVPEAATQPLKKIQIQSPQARQQQRYKKKYLSIRIG